MKLSRDEYRRIKGYSKEEMERYLQLYYNSMYNTLRKEFNDNYKDELDSSVQNFITAIAYTLHFNEDINLKNDELASFMNDLYVSVELFRTGEYNPEDGIEIAKYDYDRLYREKDAPYKEKYDKLVEFLDTTTSKAKVVDDIREIIGLRKNDDSVQNS